MHTGEAELPEQDTMKKALSDISLADIFNAVFAGASAVVAIFALVQSYKVEEMSRRREYLGEVGRLVATLQSHKLDVSRFIRKLDRIEERVEDGSPSRKAAETTEASLRRTLTNLETQFDKWMVEQNAYLSGEKVATTPTDKDFFSVAEANHRLGTVVAEVIPKMEQWVEEIDKEAAAEREATAKSKPLPPDE